MSFIHIQSKSSLSSIARAFGPAWIVMIADVDVASIVTGIQSGFAFGFHLIFIVMILTVPLALIQYVAGSVAIHTQRGIAENVRYHWGKSYSYLAAIPMATTDFLSYVAEYAGIAIGFGLLGINPTIGIIMAFILHNILVLTRSFKKIELPLIVISVILVISFVIAAVLAHPDWYAVVTQGLSPLQPYGNKNYMYLVVANIGAVVMPWMIFYQAGAIVEKKVKRGSLHMHKWENIIGALVSELIMAAIIIASSSLGGHGMVSLDTIPKIMSFAGEYLKFVIAIGFIAAGFLALVVISLSSAWGVCEALNVKFRFNEGYKNRKSFFVIFYLESFPALILTLLAVSNLISLMINLMVIYVLIDIPVLMMTGLIVKKEGFIGKRYISKKTMIFFWIFFIIIEVMGIYSIALNGFPI